jgi:hypothetical protein
MFHMDIFVSRVCSLCEKRSLIGPLATSVIQLEHQTGRVAEQITPSSAERVARCALRGPAQREANHGERIWAPLCQRGEQQTFE